MKQQHFGQLKFLHVLAFIALLSAIGCDSKPRAHRNPTANPELEKLRKEVATSRSELSAAREEIADLRFQISAIREGLGALRLQVAAARNASAISSKTDFEIPRVKLQPNMEQDVALGTRAWSDGNFVEAYRLLLPAAELGHSIAQHRMGVMYVFGQGVERNLEEAVKWFKQAAEQGQGESQFSMGMRYLKGEGVEQNPQEAVRWLDRAASQGIGVAAYTLGDLLSNGGQVAQDHVEAYKWLAIANGETEPNRKAISLEELAAKMTPEELARAKALVEQFSPQRTGLADP